MTEQEEQPLRISSTAQILDQESATSAPLAELRRKKRIRLYAIFVATFIITTIILATFELTIMRVRTPKYRINALTVDSITVSNSTNSSPSFDIQFDTKITIKNNNFGPYKYYSNFDHVNFFYGETRVRSRLLDAGSVKIKSTRRLDLKFNVSSSTGALNKSKLGRDLDSGFLRFSAKGEMRGQVEFIRFIKKDRNVKMSCNLAVNLVDKVVQELVCD